MRRLAPAIVLALLAFPAGAGAMEMDMGDSPEAAVSIQFASYSPAAIQVVTGDTVHWMNDSVRVHTVNDVNGTWASPRIVSSDGFSHTFTTAGVTTYYCILHTFMRGEVDVENILLDTPKEPGAPGRPYTLHGRTALAPGESITIEGDSGSGFQQLGVATVDHDGSFKTDVVPSMTTTYKAVSGTEASPTVQLLVLDRKLTASGSTRGRRVTIKSNVAPASPGAPVVLQLRLPLHFGWWPVARAKLDKSSRAKFAIKLNHRYPARVVLTLADGATVLATSRTLHVGPK
jgi:plastocyanin